MGVERIGDWRPAGGLVRRVVFCAAEHGLQWARKAPRIRDMILLMLLVPDNMQAVLCQATAKVQLRLRSVMVAEHVAC
jgi:hypothetical protein